MEASFRRGIKIKKKKKNVKGNCDLFSIQKNKVRYTFLRLLFFFFSSQTCEMYTLSLAAAKIILQQSVV